MYKCNVCSVSEVQYIITDCTYIAQHVEVCTVCCVCVPVQFQMGYRRDGGSAVCNIYGGKAQTFRHAGICSASGITKG